jgi:carbamate kinase
MRLVVALGGNALVPPAEAGTRAASPAALATAARILAALAGEHEVVVTHGNGPQVGLLALQARAWRPDEPERLDVLGAESEGLIGYMIERTLAPLVPGRAVATLLTQVEVAADDPAFVRPTKPIGPAYDPDDAAGLARERGWTIGVFGGRARRLVASPVPLRILESGVVRTLIAAGVIVICSGGGGIPVIVTDRGAVRGADAVIDKDRAAALLAETVEADFLLILTDVDAVYADWPCPKGRPIRRASPDRLAAFSFAEGSMAPKVEAACRFVTRTGGRAAIGALGDGPAILAGTAGTQIVPGRGVLDLGAGVPAPG